MNTKSQIFSSSTLRDLLKRDNQDHNFSRNSQNLLRRMNRRSMQSRSRRNSRTEGNYHGLDKSECRRLKKMKIGKSSKSCAICYADFEKGKISAYVRSDYHQTSL